MMGVDEDDAGGSKHPLLVRGKPATLLPIIQLYKM
jgi:hypothetical protein